MTTLLTNYEKTACLAARVAGEYLASRFRGEDIVVEHKGLHDFVTECDREAERRLVQVLLGAFPDHTVLAEEGSPEASAADYRWIVDPLDGTTNFIHGLPTFAVSVALEDPEGLAAAAIFVPLQDELFHAHRGGGAMLNGKPIRCSHVETDAEALLATGFPFKELTRLDRYLDVFETFIQSTAGIRRAGSAAVDLAYTACGRYDGFWECGLSAWDVAAGILLVREAGGVATDLVGGDNSLESGDILAAGQSLYSRMLEVTRPEFSETD